MHDIKNLDEKMLKIQQTVYLMKKGIIKPYKEYPSIDAFIKDIQNK